MAFRHATSRRSRRDERSIRRTGVADTNGAVPRVGRTEDGADPQAVVISLDWFAHTPFTQVAAQYIDEALPHDFEHLTSAAQAAARQHAELGDGGSMILLSSVVSQMPFVHTNLVGVSLAATRVVARMAAVDLGPHRIRVDVV